MPKCDFNKVAAAVLKSHFGMSYSPINLLHTFRTPFPKNTSGVLLLWNENKVERFLASLYMVYKKCYNQYKLFSHCKME